MQILCDALNKTHNFGMNKQDIIKKIKNTLGDTFDHNIEFSKKKYKKVLKKLSKKLNDDLNKSQKKKKKSYKNLEIQPPKVWGT
jgi:biotin synthase-like enzyme